MIKLWSKHIMSHKPKCASISLNQRTLALIQITSFQKSVIRQRSLCEGLQKYGCGLFLKVEADTFIQSWRFREVDTASTQRMGTHISLSKAWVLTLEKDQSFSLRSLEPSLDTRGERLFHFTHLLILNCLTASCILGSIGPKYCKII